ncbi:TPA: DUF1656 domain-containing protein [Pseudomonas aeruginosa]
MTAELDLAGVFISPLLLCLLIAFFGRILLSRLFNALGLYRYVWHRTLFDISLFFSLVGLVFAVFSAVTSTT